MQVGGRAALEVTTRRGRPPAALTRPSAPTSVMQAADDLRGAHLPRSDRWRADGPTGTGSRALSAGGSHGPGHTGQRARNSAQRAYRRQSWLPFPQDLRDRGPTLQGTTTGRAQHNVKLCCGRFHKMQVGGRAIPKGTKEHGRPPASLTRPSAPTAVRQRAPLPRLAPHAEQQSQRSVGGARYVLPTASQVAEAVAVTQLSAPRRAPEV